MSGGRGVAPRNRVVAIAVAALVAAGLVADRSDPAPSTSGIAAAFAGPEAAPATALSSTWFCAAGRLEPYGAATGAVVLANPTERDLTSRITVHPAEGEPSSEVVEVPALGVVRRPVHRLSSAPVSAVQVDAVGGGLVVEHSLNGTGGRVVSPCSPGASTEWHFATGDTEKGARELVALHNPFPDPAIVDFRFATDDGFVAPPALTGVVVDARRVRVVDVGEHVRREAQVALSVEARTGRLVAERYQVLDGTRSQEGAALSLGAPSPGLEWSFPEGILGPGVSEQVHVYNPGEREASVDLELYLEDGAAEPFALAVPPDGYVTVDVGEDGRVPEGVAHAMVARSINGVPVVVEREVTSGGDAARSGISLMLGARRAATQVVVADGRTTEAVDEWVVVFNPGAGPVEVSFGALVGGQILPVADLQSLEVPARSRRAFRLGDHIERDPLALLVRASGPVVVERGLYAASGTGMSAALGVPLV